MKENKDSRIEIRIPHRIKELLQQEAKKNNISMSKLLYNLILTAINEEE